MCPNNFNLQITPVESNNLNFQKIQIIYVFELS